MFRYIIKWRENYTVILSRFLKQLQNPATINHKFLHTTELFKMKTQFVTWESRHLPHAILRSSVNTWLNPFRMNVEYKERCFLLFGSFINMNFNTNSDKTNKIKHSKIIKKKIINYALINCSLHILITTNVLRDW